MAAFGGFGFDTVGGMRDASRQGKAKKATDRMAASAKPVTDTSGTAQKKGAGGNGSKQLMRQINFGMEQGGPGGAISGFMGLPFTKRVGGRPMTIDTVNQQIVNAGSRIKPAAASQPSAPKTVTKTGSGIDAPAPDTGWRPSGINSAFGLEQAKMGIPLQETVGVSKRKR